jgi:hypothetical protein
MSQTWIEHHDRKILYSDYRGLTEKQMIENMELGYKMMHPCSGGVLVLVNVQGEFPIKIFMEHFSLSGRSKDAYMIAKLAAVGVKTGVMSIFLEEMSASKGITARLFNTEQEAKDWLIA